MEEIQCNYSNEEIAKDFIEDVSKVEELLDDLVNSSKTKDVLVIKANYHIPADMLHYWRERILKERESGVILLPYSLSAEIVPADVEIKFEGGSKCPQTPDQN